jgi:hypothetical protein
MSTSSKYSKSSYVISEDDELLDILLGASSFSSVIALIYIYFVMLRIQ